MYMSLYVWFTIAAPLYMTLGHIDNPAQSQKWLSYWFIWIAWYFSPFYALFQWIPASNIMHTLTGLALWYPDASIAHSLFTTHVVPYRNHRLMHLIKCTIQNPKTLTPLVRSISRLLHFIGQKCLEQPLIRQGVEESKRWKHIVYQELDACQELRQTTHISHT